ncbi:MAG: dihydrodipicolinate synthase family protein [Planctomycetota bacterium]
MVDNPPVERLRTVHLVPLTAFEGPEQRLALEPMRSLTTRLHEAGVKAFIPCAGSAEFYAVSPDEIVAAVEMTHSVVGTSALTIAPIGFQLSTALDVGRRSLEKGADAVMVMPPVGPYLSDVGLRDYYRTIFDELDAPVIVYKKGDLPSDQLLLELADHPRFVAVKYAVNDIDAFQRIVDADGGRIEWICGSAERFAPYFWLSGSRGYTSGAGNICPRVTLAMHDALERGDWERGMHFQRIIRPIEDFRARAGNSFNISFLKHALVQTGLDFGPPRTPQRRVTHEEKREIDAMLPPILEAEAALATAAV